MAALSLTLKKALTPTASASLSLIKRLSPITSSAQRGWFCSCSSTTCPESKYYSSSHDDTSDTDTDISDCPRAYDNPLVKIGTRKLFELDMQPHEARVRVDLPGVNSYGIKVFFHDDDLRVWGKELPLTEESRAYACSIKLRQIGLLKKEETRAEIQNGVLRVIIPKHVPQEEEEEELLEEEEEEDNQKDGPKFTVPITSPADVPVSMKF